MVQSDSVVVSTERKEVHLTAFDFATEMKQGQSYKHKRVGTMAWLAPEVCEGRYGYKADIWSFGMFMHELLQGEPPLITAQDIKEVKIL